MDQEGEVVIRAADGTEHVFPAGFDPKKAAGIVQRNADYEALQQRMNVDAGVGPDAGKANAIAAGVVGAGLGAAAIGPAAIGATAVNALRGAGAGALYGGLDSLVTGGPEAAIKGALHGAAGGALIGGVGGQFLRSTRLGRLLTRATGSGTPAKQTGEVLAHASESSAPSIASTMPQTAEETVNYLRSLKPSTISVPEELTPWKLRELRHLGQAGRDAVLRALGQGQ